MAQKVALLGVVMLAGANAAAIRGTSSSFLATGDGERMRPELVASTLATVEDEWRKQAAVFTEGSPSAAKEAPGSFAKSCATVVSAVIQGSGGDRDVAKEYMTNVCGQKVLSGWHKLRCTALASRITDHAMLADSYANRENLNPAKVCSGYWSIFVEAERNRKAEEAKERAEQEKVRAEEEKKAAIAAAEAKKIADAEAKVKAEKKAKEDARREQEEKEQKAKREAAEAKTRAAEAAARLAQKKAEAEKVQKEAQQKLEEAEKAEKEHKARLAEHQKAEELLHNATKSASLTKPADEHSKSSAKLVVASPEVPKPAAKPAVNEVAAEAKPAAKPVAKLTAKPAPEAKVVTAPQKADVATKVEAAAKPAATSKKVASKK